MEGLLNCPFCGGEAEIIDHGGFYTINCTSPDCAATIDLLEPSEEAAATDWNRRAAPESVDINHLEDLLDGIVQAMPDPAGVTKCAIELRCALEGIRRAAWTGSQP